MNTIVRRMIKYYVPDVSTISNVQSTVMKKLSENSDGVIMNQTKQFEHDALENIRNSVNENKFVGFNKRKR